MSKDLFSGHSRQYAAFRPSYPQALYDFIMKHVGDNKAAWDCACGNGQVAKNLSTRFDKVYATDHSAPQLENAFQKDNIIYSLAPAEKTPFTDRQFDLIAIGQAIHWFNIPAFFSEARRVSKPGGVIAVWGYSLLGIDAKVDPIINHFYTKVVGPYWDKERKLIDDRYTTIEFPFETIEAPPFEFSFQWTLDELIGYLNTWSSVQKFIKQNERNPVEDVAKEISPLWHSGTKKISFPLFTMIGRV